MWTHFSQTVQINQIGQFDLSRLPRSQGSWNRWRLIQVLLQLRLFDGRKILPLSSLPC